MRNRKNASLFLLGIVCHSVKLFQRASAINVYNDAADWHNAVFEVKGQIRAESFNDAPQNYQLSPGSTDLDFLSFTIDNEEPFMGFYKDFFTNRGQYFIGSILTNESNNTFIEIKPRSTIGGPAIAFGADFVDTLSDALLTLTVNGETIKFSDYLTDTGILNNKVLGNGFLGFVLPYGTSFSKITFGLERKNKTGEQFFMDNLMIALSEKDSMSMSYFY